MRLREGSIVRDAEGQDIGRLRQLVLGDDATAITHLVIGKGVLFPEDRVVSVEAVDRTTDDGIFLKPGRSPDSFTPFEDGQYVEIGHAGAAGMMPHPVTTPPPTPKHTSAELDSDPAPLGSASIAVGTPVIGVRGMPVGKVEEVIAADDGSVESVVARRGMLWFKKRTVIPAVRIARAGTHAVRLNIDAGKAIDAGDTVGQLPPTA